ncbi:MAG: peptidoglycan DD-metalloendopeptidase family protein [Anaerolineae bacterium]|nr:peptidoglycan DD-metalloendopeptidase family protein [Anaerolineae bacterium]
MSPLLEALLLLHARVNTWLQQQVWPLLGLNKQVMAFGFFRGIYDTVLLVLLGTGLVVGSSMYMNGQYDLPRDIQATAVQWAPVADSIARSVDIPREVPLVLWFKENSMLAVNPANCTGIMGAYDLVRSGAHPCFTPGPIADLEIHAQLRIGAEEFKKRCPEITYFTQDSATIKKCYFAYNAGMGAARRLDADDSAYVMNLYDAAHTNMIYSDIELGTVEMKTLGAWPAHLAFQSLITGQLDVEGRPFALTLLYISLQFYDLTSSFFADLMGGMGGSEVSMNFPAYRALPDGDCLGEAHVIGRPSLRPRFNPVSESPLLTQDIHGCSYGLPGLDISSSNSTAVLQAPIAGELTTYTDQWYNSTIRIENDEWIVWLLHARTFFIAEGNVKQGQAVGVMGAVGIATGPHVHYTVFDKMNDTFVDPRPFLP